MRRVFVILIAVVLVAAACGSDDPASDTTVAPPTTAAPTTTAASTSTTSSTTSPPTTVPKPPTPFSDGSSFALQAGPDEWSKTFIDPGAVVFRDGEWHMFYNGLASYPAHVDVGYATSPDGIKWTKQSPEPVFTTSEIPYAGISAFMSTAVVLDDGTWAMWFYTIESANAATGEIGRVTAPGPLGPWTADPEPALVRGPEGSWDSRGVQHPSVLRVGDEWWMWFDGNMGDLESEGDRSIGLASSPDGVTWTRFDDPTTTDAPYASGDPVVVTDAGAWDERRVFDPGVESTEDGFVMTYFTRTPGTRSPLFDIGLAFSADGVHWDKDARNPFFRSGSNGFTGIFLSSLIRTDEGYVLLYDAQSSAGGGTTAWYRLHEGPLGPVEE